MRLVRSLVAVLAAFTFAGGIAQAAVPRFDHVVIIMLENHSAKSIVGNPDAPKITALALAHGYASAYYGVTHPSLPNYIAITSGNNWYSNSDDPSQRFDHRNLVDQLEGHHISWKAYLQSMPAVGFMGEFYPRDEANALYVIRHNPFMLYDDIRNNPGRRTRDVPIDRLWKDLAVRSLPQFAWISPDICHDMHGMSGKACPYSNDDKLRRDADNYVAMLVTRITTSPSWTKRSVIFIMTDETDYTGDKRYGGWLNALHCCDSPLVPKGFAEYPQGGVYGGGLVPLLVISSIGKQHFVGNLSYNHYSVLRTVETAWNLGYLGMAGDSPQVRDLGAFFEGH